VRAGAQHNDSFETITPVSFKRLLGRCALETW